MLLKLLLHCVWRPVCAAGHALIQLHRKASVTLGALVLDDVFQDTRALYELGQAGSVAVLEPLGKQALRESLPMVLTQRLLAWPHR
jgi:hypothetical protein